MIAKAIMGEKAVCDAVPWFWSDQYDLSLQIAGLPTWGLDGARLMDDGAVILFHLTPSGRIVGATGFGRAESIGRDVRLAQILIAKRAHPDPAVARSCGRAEIDRQSGEGEEIRRHTRIIRRRPPDMLSP